MMGRKADRVRGAVRLEALLARDQPGLFAAIGELDWYSGSHRRWIDDQGFRAGDRVLEVGCATGALTAYLADIGCSVTGLDRSDDMIRRARNDHPHLDLLVGDATLLPYDNHAFDGVVAASVINVVPDPEVVLTEMQRVCTPGGTVSVLVPSADFFDNNLDALVETLELRGFSEAVLSKWHRSAPKMSPVQLERLCHSAHLESVTTRSYLEGMLLAVTATTTGTASKSQS